MATLITTRQVRALAPRLSIIVPVRNEAKYIQGCLQSILQNAPPGGLEVLVVDGRSDDGTADLVREMALSDDRIRLIDNPSLFVPNAMNLGIRASSSEYVGRIDGHCRVEPGYFTGCLEVLESSTYACVGGALVNEGDSATGRAVAAAMSSPLGVGSVGFRTGAPQSKEVDTVGFGVYRRDIFDRIGYFDESFIRNQDDELNLRLIRGGAKILLVPELRIRYTVRSSLAQLYRQYFQYGYWKLAVMMKHKGFASVRHIVPSLFLVGIACLAVMSAWSTLAVLALGAVLALYVAALLLEGLRMSIRRRCSWLLTASAIATMHFSYGWGLISAIGGSGRGRKHTRLSR